MGLLRYIGAVLVALASAFLYYRSNVLYTFYANSPERLPRVNNIGDFQIKFPKILRNCEDAYLSETEGWILLSCDPGRDKWNTVMGTFNDSRAPDETGLYLYKYSEGSEAKPEKVQIYPSFQTKNASEFHPLGIEVHEPSRQVFVVNHAASGSKIDMYKLNTKGAYLTFMGTFNDTINMPTPNAIAAVSEFEFFVTNDHYWQARKNPNIAKFETYAGIKGGTVSWVKTVKVEAVKEPVATGKTLVRVPFANGVALLNDTTLAVSSSSTAAIRLYHIYRNATTAAPMLVYLKKIQLPFLPDNLSVDSKGKLLIAGHPHAPSLEKVAKNNVVCSKKKNAKLSVCKGLNKLSWVAEWSEEEGLKTLYSGSVFGTSSTAVRDNKRGVGFVTGLYERGLLAWEE